VEQTIRGPNWAMLTHRDSENDPMARCFSQWLSTQLAEPEPPAQTAVK
jgi:LysR family glycine cleavage system transcriptional activator